MDKLELYKSLGIETKATKKKIIPNGKDYIIVRDIVRTLNTKIEDKFLGFFPNLKNNDKTFYIVTKDFKLHYDNSVYKAYIKMFSKKYPNLPVKFQHMYGDAYTKILAGEGLYIE